jgi:hypothetical protein
MCGWEDNAPHASAIALTGTKDGEGSSLKRGADDVLDQGVIGDSGLGA